jgi:hypothetical protein
MGVVLRWKEWVNRPSWRARVAAETPVMRRRRTTSGMWVARGDPSWRKDHRWEALGGVGANGTARL